MGGISHFLRDRMILKMMVAGRRDLSGNNTNRICVSFGYGSEFVRQEGKGRYVEKSARILVAWTSLLQVSPAPLPLVHRTTDRDYHHNIVIRKL